MKQVLIIHGGSSYSKYESYIRDLETSMLNYDRLKYAKKWKQWIAEQMPDADVLLPTFPNSSNAQFDEWVIYFEKIVPFLDDDVSLVGHSLGGMFLAKYLQDRTLSKPVKQIILVAPRYGDDNDDGSFAVTSAVEMPKNAASVHLFHSKDDPVVSYDSLGKFAADMPHAIVHSFDNRGHFNDETFPELLEILKQK